MKRVFVSRFWNYWQKKKGKNHKMNIKLFRPILLIGFVFSSTGCSVSPWERGNLAKRSMLITPNPIHSTLRSHVFDSKEASAGGSGAAGGGCGCN